MLEPWRWSLACRDSNDGGSPRIEGRRMPPAGPVVGVGEVGMEGRAGAFGVESLSADAFSCSIRAAN